MTAAVIKNKAAQTENKTAVKCRIHFADGNKGGVGKSFLARTLYQCLIDRGMPVMGVEADIDSPDFKGIYQDVQVSRFSEEELAGGQANDIINWAINEQTNIVVNLPATVHKPFALWLNQFSILDVAEETGIELVKWFVCTGEYDSMKSLGVSLKTFGGAIPHVIVKNLKYPDWTFFDADEETQGLIQQYQCPVIQLPKLTVSIANLILQQRLTFGDAVGYKSRSFGTVQQIAVKGFLKQADAAFDATGLV